MVLHFNMSHSDPATARPYKKIKKINKKTVISTAHTHTPNQNLVDIWSCGNLREFNI